MAKTALIVGAGSGISASFARLLRSAGYGVALAARNAEKLIPFGSEIGARTFTVDSTNSTQVAALFDDVSRTLGQPELVLYNASARVRGPVIELDPAAVEHTIAVSAFGGFLVAQQAAKLMVVRGAGTILFTGASASVKGYPGSAPFAMGKFALRGLAQSMARELHPRGIHVAHFVIDGGVRNQQRDRIEKADAMPDSLLDPDAIAETYMHVVDQPRSAWSWEIEVRPWTERF